MAIDRFYEIEAALCIRHIFEDRSVMEIWEGGEIKIIYPQRGVVDKNLGQPIEAELDLVDLMESGAVVWDPLKKRTLLAREHYRDFFSEKMLEEVNLRVKI